MGGEASVLYAPVHSPIRPPGINSISQSAQPTIMQEVSRQIAQCRCADYVSENVFILFYSKWNKAALVAFIALPNARPPQAARRMISRNRSRHHLPHTGTNTGSHQASLNSRFILQPSYALAQGFHLNHFSPHSS